MDDKIIDLEIDLWVETKHSFDYDEETSNTEEDDLVKYRDF